MQILLVEDAPFFERVVRRHLSDLHGCEIRSADTLARARSLLERGEVAPDVALVDLTLPDAPDGEIVDLTMAAGVPTIVFTGRFDDRMREQLLARGVVDYVLKDTPASLGYLAGLVKRICLNSGIDALVVDDSRTDTEVISRRLERYRLRVHTASSHDEALARLPSIANLRLVVLDYVMPRVDGFTLLQALRRRFGMDELAVIGLSGRAEAEVVARFLKSGANDFVTKSCSPEEFMLRISQNLDMLDRIAALTRLAHRDELTGLSNRRHLFADGRARYEQLARAGRPVAVAVIDLDMLKTVNDRFGHESGDLLIASFGALLAELAPAGAFAARLGGDEFCLVLPDVAPSACAALLERLAARLAQVPLPGKASGQPIPLTFSAGLSSGTEPCLDEALRNADARLYEAKKAGRNRIVAGPLAADGPGA